MDETPIYSLPFPTSEDFANGALDLQVLAEAADTAISGVRSQYTALTRRPTAVWQSTSDASYSSLSSFLPVQFQSQIYSNDPSFTSIANRNFPFPSSGLWMFGAYLNCVASGTITALSQRAMQIEADQPTGLKAFDYVPIYFGDSIFETSVAGGDFMTVVGVINFQAVAGTIANRWATVTFVSGNTGSNMLVKAGALFFMHKLSNLDF